MVQAIRSLTFNMGYRLCVVKFLRPEQPLINTKLGYGRARCVVLSFFCECGTARFTLAFYTIRDVSFAAGAVTGMDHSLNGKNA